jgi:predicted aspartyl protease
MILKLILFISLFASSINLLFAQNSKTEIYNKYINCNFNYFLDNESEDALFNGLKAIIYGEYDKAEELLLSVIPDVSDSLKESICFDLVYINYTRKNWLKGNEYIVRGDPDYDTATNPFNYFGKYPKLHLKMSGNSTSVDFIDNFYIQGTINDNDKAENIIVDTGAGYTVISSSLALKYNFQIDSTKLMGVMSGQSISTSAHSALINKLKIGEVTFFNVPVIVAEDKVFKAMGVKGEIILGIPVMMMFDIVQFDYPNKKFSMIRKTEKKDIKPNFALVDLKPIISYNIRNEVASAIFDTGSPYTYLYAAHWDANKEKKIRSEDQSFGKYKFKVDYYKIPLSLSGGIQDEFEITIHTNRNPPNRFVTTSLLGNDIWLDKKVVIDFKNRLINFE